MRFFVSQGRQPLSIGVVLMLCADADQPRKWGSCGSPVICSFSADIHAVLHFSRKTAVINWGCVDAMRRCGSAEKMGLVWVSRDLLLFGGRPCGSSFLKEDSRYQLGLC